MTFAELKTELAARGFDPVTDARRGQMINRARSELDELARWPYREASATGTGSPLIIADLGEVEAVIDMRTKQPLQHVDYQMLLGIYGDLSITGTPECWYRATPAGIPEVATYPVSTGQIGVQYWRITPDLVNPGDEPAAPERYHGLIVDMAVRRAYQDNDDHANAGFLAQSIAQDVALMTRALLSQNEPVYQQITYSSEDW